MSIRGAVAVGTLANWRGVYCHSDSYRTWLGKRLYEHLQAELSSGKMLAEVGEDILHFDDWRNYLKSRVCEYCGQMRSQPRGFSYMPTGPMGRSPIRRESIAPTRKPQRSKVEHAHLSNGDDHGRAGKLFPRRITEHR